MTAHRSPWSKEDVKELKAHSKARTPVAKFAKAMKRKEGTPRRKAGILGIGLGHDLRCALFRHPATGRGSSRTTRRGSVTSTVFTSQLLTAFHGPGFNKINGLANQSRTAREPLLARWIMPPRLLHRGPVHRLMDVNLLSLDQRIASRHPSGFGGLNPGFAVAADCPIRPGPDGPGDRSAVLPNADRPAYR